MKILLACECSGKVRNALAKRGHDAWSCDLIPSDTPGQHIQGDVLKVIRQGWDMMIAFPPCTYLTVSGLHWNKRVPERARKTEDALEFVRELLDAPIDKIGLENPVGCISSRIRTPDQIIQPYEFGDDASKKTCLWLKNLPPLKQTNYFPPRVVEWPKGSGKKVNRWGNQTNSGQNKLGPSEDRAKIRSETYQGIADAIATQWG